MDALRDAWDAYNPNERKIIGIFILGLMFYKFGLEIFIGSIIPLASDRFGENFFDCDESQGHSVIPGHLETFRKVGVLTGVNQAMQCLGSILVAPLMQRYQTRQVLVGATVAFALLTSILLICDAATGGRPRHWGGYDPIAIFPVYCISGIAHGMIELIRRVLPREIVDGDVSKFKHLDSAVHVFYEIAGTIGPITAVKLIDSVGENISFFLSPVSLALAGLVWFFIPVEPGVLPPAVIPNQPAGYLRRLANHVAFLGGSIWEGCIAVLGHGGRYIWLVPCYSFALLAHRYLENNIANIYAKGVIQKASYQPLIIVGSNLGELLGAATVFFTVDIISSPIPFVRLDALFLLLSWFIPFFPVSGHTLNDALSMAALFMLMSGSWAAGDVSLNASLQADFIFREALSARQFASIMSFLYVAYIASYTLLSSLLGLVVDTVLGKDGPCSPNFSSDTRTALIYVGGILFTVISFTMLTSSFFRGGAFAWNPMHWHLQQGGVPNGHLLGPMPPGPPAPAPAIAIAPAPPAPAPAPNPTPAPAHVPTRPLPKIPLILSRGSNDIQHQSLLLSPTHSTPFSTPGPH